MHGNQGSTANEYPAPDESTKGNYTQAVQNWFVRSSDKDGQSFEIRFWLPSAASVNGVRRWTGLRSFSTCLVSVDFKLVTSPAIKDGAYDQETIEISTNKVSNYQLGSPDEDHRRAKF